MQLELCALDLRYADLRIRDAVRERRLVASLLEHGQQTPVLVVRDESAWVLIDGYVRVEALGKLARDLVEAAVLEMAEAEALVLGHRLDNGRERTALEEGWLLRELCERHGVVQRDLAHRLDRSTSWVSRRLGLVSTLPEAVQEAVRAGKLGVQAATKYLVPLARANADQCEQLVSELDGEPVTVRQMERLYVAWKGGDAEQRQQLCREPKLFLRAQAAERDDDDEPEGDEHAAMMSDLARLSAVCLRLCRRLAEQGDGPVTERARRARREAWARAGRAFETLRTHFDERDPSDARPRHANGDLAPRKRRAQRPNDCTDSERLPRLGPQGAA
jgi:ParB family chromosome partitioning protein